MGRAILWESGVETRSRGGIQNLGRVSKCLAIFNENNTLLGSTAGAGDAAASSRKFFGAKSRQIWAKMIKIWANLIRFEQNKNLAAPKHYTFLSEPVNSELRLAVLNFLRIFSLNRS